MRHRILFILFLILGSTSMSSGQKHLGRQLDSLEKQFKVLDSMNHDLEKKSKELEDLIKERETELDQAEGNLAEEEPEGGGSGLSTAMTLVIAGIFILGLFWFLRRKRTGDD